MDQQSIELDPRQFRQMRAEGRGLGHGKDYKSWIFAASTKPYGNKTRWIGRITGREHQVLSDPEYYAGNIIDFSPQVTDIREQYPLWPIEETLEIGHALGVEHPNKRRKGSKAKYIVMTTDFVIDVESNRGTVSVARAVKKHRDLEDPRVLEKLEIERIYWERRGIDWGIITDQDYDETMATNIAEVIRPHRTLEGRMNLPDSELKRLSRELTEMVQERDEPLSAILREFERRNNIPQGEAISLPWFLIANRHWTVDLCKKLDPFQKIELISTNIE